jgi:hypothetical protein
LFEQRQYALRRGLHELVVRGADGTLRIEKRLERGGGIGH